MIAWIARLSVRNSVAVNLGVLAVVATGIVAYLRMPREVFPEFSLDQVVISTIYPGASPEDVERLVTLPIESELDGLDDLDEMTSISQEGMSVVTLKIEARSDVQRFLDDVRSRIQSGALELPDEAEEPFVREIRAEFPVIAVFVYGNASEDVLREVGREQERLLEDFDGVSSVQATGIREPRVWVEVDPLALERYGLSLSEVGSAVGGRVRNVPLGSLSTDSGDYLLRVDSDVATAADLVDMPLVTRPDGTVVRLSRVARVFDTFERERTLARFNGLPCIHLAVNKSAEGDTIEIAEAIGEHVAKASETLPPGISMGTSSDLSIYVENRLRVMGESATLGGVLVLVSLILFLSVRVAFLTAIGIPISFLGGLLLASLFGITMNMMTMFALIIVLGMVVDDAIVVAENGYRLMEEGLSPEEAAVRGTAEVGAPVIATILTTMAAFLPILIMEGTMGQFMRPLPLIVTFCLLASLAEALLVLPAHLAHWTKKREAGGTSGETRWYEPARRVYARLLAFALRWRYVTIAASVATATLVLGFAVKQMPFNLFDDFESKVLYVNIHTQPGNSLRETEALALPIQDRLLAFPESELQSTNLLVGVLAKDASQFEVRQDVAQIWVELREDASDKDRRTTAEIIEEMRSIFRDPPPGVEAIEIDQPQGGPTGKAIELNVRGPELETLIAISETIKARLAEFAGVRDVRDNTALGKREVKLLVTDEGRALGFDETRLGAELRSAFEGVRFANVRRGRDDVEVVVKLPEYVRDERGALETLRVSAPLGGRVPLASVAKLEEFSGPSVISRDDGERAVKITADVNKSESSAAAITAVLRDEFATLGETWPGYSVEFEGDYQETANSLASLELSLTIAVVSIFVILGALFRSMTQPFVIMFAIPLAGIGAVAGHLLMGRGLSMMSLVGFLALAGIVVNDSLILVERVNSLRGKGARVLDALRTAGRERFRPIVLTSITTMLGLSPLTFFATGQARFLQPMAISIFFGLAFSTILILVVVPVAYAVLCDVLRVERASGVPEPGGAEPAFE